MHRAGAQAWPIIATPNITSKVSALSLAFEEIVRVGVDLAKQVIHVHAVAADGRVLANRPLARERFLGWCGRLPPGCLVAMEACSGAHHWARCLRELGLDARLVSAGFTSVYRLQGRHGKNDANAAALYAHYAHFGADAPARSSVSS